jgi:hypothetical protein
MNCKADRLRARSGQPLLFRFPNASMTAPCLPGVVATTPKQRRRLRSHLLRQRRAQVTLPELPISLENAAPHPSSDEERKLARVIRNREVALQARLATKARLTLLQDENSVLANRADSLLAQNSTLKTQIHAIAALSTSNDQDNLPGPLPVQHQVQQHDPAEHLFSFQASQGLHLHPQLHLVQDRQHQHLQESEHQQYR